MADGKRAVPNYEIKAMLELMQKEIREFKDQYEKDMRGEADFKVQYELDMRGNKSIDDKGNIGIIGEIRELRRIITEYPSLLWLLRNRTSKTVTTIIAIFMLLSLLYIDEVRLAIFTWIGLIK